MGYMIFNIANIIIDTIPQNAEVMRNVQDFNNMPLIITIVATIITIASAVATFIALRIAILGIRQSNELKKEVENAKNAAEQTKTAATEAKGAAGDTKNAAEAAKKASEDTQKVADEIADYTRKPLNGIKEVLSQIYKLIKDHKPYTKFYYLGLTLGIGPAHATEEIIEKWDEDNSPFKAGADDYSFTEMYGKLNEKLQQVVLSPDTCIVCLNRRYVYRDFIEPLYQNKYKKEIPKTLHAKISKLHNDVVEVNNTKKNANKVRYINTIPIQVMGAQLSNGREAVIVFNVGTTNAGSDEVLGFYSEATSMCNLFSEYVKALYEYKPNKVNP